HTRSDRDWSSDVCSSDLGLALDLDPGLAEAYAHRGNAERDQGQLEKAFQDLVRAIELDPTDPYLHLDLGVIHCNRGAWTEAQAEIGRASCRERVEETELG